MVISCLKKTKYGKTAAGQQELLDFISEIMELDRDFDPLEDGIVDRVIVCTTHALSLFSVSLNLAPPQFLLLLSGKK